eukprot:3019832-Prorocentrum_lima.AAC.1
MTSSLVGSEMCIRDSGLVAQTGSVRDCPSKDVQNSTPISEVGRHIDCLLYTSDAADDMQV